ncbi:hypothetical protein [Actinoplanes sp. NPDC051851]|uniref:hypothetical protein n=1 Tax=Actinoplanes sp. NPDC051851 TaxID=3154753 RepID=UPI003434E511
MDLGRVLGGLWVVHPEVFTTLGATRFRRRPASHLAFDGDGWQRYETGRRARFPRAGHSEGSWRAVALDDRQLLVFTVRSHRPSGASEVLLESNLSYTGGALAVASTAERRRTSAERMRLGDACMYFLPVLVHPGEIVVSLPSDGMQAPRQRWTRLE